VIAPFAVAIARCNPFLQLHYLEATLLFLGLPARHNRPLFFAWLTKHGKTPMQSGLQYNEDGTRPGAQTERSGLAGPVRALLGGETSPAIL
jgi:hypothetical protein